MEYDVTKQFNPSLTVGARGDAVHQPFIWRPKAAVLRRAQALPQYDGAAISRREL
jgi:hypothetical protein